MVQFRFRFKTFQKFRFRFGSGLVAPNFKGSDSVCWVHRNQIFKVLQRNPDFKEVRKKSDKFSSLLSIRSWPQKKTGKTIVLNLLSKIECGHKQL